MLFMRWPVVCSQYSLLNAMRRVQWRAIAIHTSFLASSPNWDIVLVKDNADFVHQSDLFLIISRKVVFAAAWAGSSNYGGIDFWEKTQDILGGDGGGRLGNCSRGTHFGRAIGRGSEGVCFVGRIDLLIQICRDEQGKGYVGLGVRKPLEFHVPEDLEHLSMVLLNSQKQRQRLGIYVLPEDCGGCAVPLVKIEKTSLHEARLCIVSRIPINHGPDPSSVLIDLGMKSGIS